MSERVFDLFDEYAAAYARGERPSAEAYLARAGEGADELATLLSGFVASAPVSAAAPSDAAAFELWVKGGSPLRRLRTERGKTLEQVVETLVERLGLDRAKREKVRRYYRELEAGLLDASRVSERVWDTLAALLGAPIAARQASIQARPFAAARHEMADSAPAAAAPPAPARAERDQPPPDEIDGLFRGGSERR